jgi:hypothetical protein
VLAFAIYHLRCHYMHPSQAPSQPPSQAPSQAPSHVSFRRVAHQPPGGSLRLRTERLGGQRRQLRLERARAGRQLHEPHVGTRVEGFARYPAVGGRDTTAELRSHHTQREELNVRVSFRQLR